MVQHAKRFIQPESGGFRSCQRVERVGLSDLAEGQKLAFEVVAYGRSGKSSADRLTLAARNEDNCEKRRKLWERFGTTQPWAGGIKNQHRREPLNKRLEDASFVDRPF